MPPGTPADAAPARLPDLEDLQTFCAAVEHGAITSAARALYITQPAASKRIRRLERFLGETLLERTSSGTRPTGAGRGVYVRARRALDAAEAVFEGGLATAPR